MTTLRHVYQLPGDAFGGSVCRGLPALRTPAQAVCRQPPQLNVSQDITLASAAKQFLSDLRRCLGADFVFHTDVL